MSDEGNTDPEMWGRRENRPRIDKYDDDWILVATFVGSVVFAVIVTTILCLTNGTGGT